jgi:uridylate kinase
MRERILLKISGEALGGSAGVGYDPTFIKTLVADMGRVYESGVDIAIVVGGGNLFRGKQGEVIGLYSASGDQMGMLGTIMNGIVLRDLFYRIGIPCTVLSSLSCLDICDVFSVAKGKEILNQRRVLICVGGTGCPYFTTDTASVVMAASLNCSVLMKGTKFSGIFSKDPAKFKDAKHLDRVSYDQALTEKLNVMDMTAFEIAQKERLPIVVFSLFEQNPISSVLAKTCQFTVVSDKGNQKESSC